VSPLRACSFAARAFQYSTRQKWKYIAVLEFEKFQKPFQAWSEIPMVFYRLESLIPFSQVNEISGFHREHILRKFLFLGYPPHGSLFFGCFAGRKIGPITIREIS
jgi:hypothetical protein